MPAFLVLESNMAELDYRLEKLNKRARRLKLPEITTRVLSVIEPTKGGPKGRQRKWEIEILGLAPKLPGWAFVGTLEHLPAGNVLRVLPGEAVPEAFRSAKAWCAHCNKARNRKDTYLVRSDAGELKQVARTCLKDFMGHASPERFGFLAETIRDMEELGGEGCMRSAPLSFGIIEFLSVVAAACRQFGFTSVSAARAYAEKSEGHGLVQTTIGRVWFELDPSPQACETKRKRPISEVIDVKPEDEALAVDALAWARALPEAQSSDYMHNLRISASKDWLAFNDRSGGILASLVSAYQREVLKQEQERTRKATFAEMAARSTYQGEVGKRQDWTLKLTKKFDLGPGDYSREGESRFLFAFEDEAGNRFTWFSGNAGVYKTIEIMSADAHALPYDVFEPYEEGKTYVVRGTVKRHDEYKGIKQTVLSRCKLTERKAPNG